MDVRQHAQNQNCTSYADLMFEPTNEALPHKARATHVEELCSYILVWVNDSVRNHTSQAVVGNHTQQTRHNSREGKIDPCATTS